MWFSLQWTVHCTRKPLLTVSARITRIYKQLSRSVNNLSQSFQQSSIQPIRSWYQELVSWNRGINGMSTGSPAQSLLTRPLSIHPVRPRLHSAISNGSLFSGYYFQFHINDHFIMPVGYKTLQSMHHLFADQWMLLKLWKYKYWFREIALSFFVYLKVLFNYCYCQYWFWFSALLPMCFYYLISTYSNKCPHSNSAPILILEYDSAVSDIIPSALQLLPCLTMANHVL